MTDNVPESPLHSEDEGSDACEIIRACTCVNQGLPRSEQAAEIPGGDVNEIEQERVSGSLKGWKPLGPPERDCTYADQLPQV